MPLVRWLPIALLLLTACLDVQDTTDDQGRWRLMETTPPAPNTPGTPGVPGTPTDTSRSCSAGDLCFGPGCACFDVCWGDTIYIRDCVQGRWACPEDTIATEVCPPLSDTCDPTNASTCDLGQACYYNLELRIFACMTPGERKQGARCYFDNACVAGMLCVPEQPDDVGMSLNRCYPACEERAGQEACAGTCTSMRNRGFGRQDGYGFCTMRSAP